MKQTKKHTIKLTPEEIRCIYKDYQFDLDSLEYDDETLALFTSFNKLTEAEKIIMELYAEFSSQRKVADLLNVSRTTIVKSLNAIRKKILDNG